MLHIWNGEESWFKSTVVWTMHVLLAMIVVAASMYAVKQLPL
jgi:hypothetical protein